MKLIKKIINIFKREPTHMFYYKCEKCFERSNYIKISGQKYCATCISNTLNKIKSIGKVKAYVIEKE